MQTFRVYESMEDDGVVALVQNGETEPLEFLIEKYRNFVRAKASKYFLIGGDKEDIVQEGMIGLFKAIRDYRSDKLTSFKGFAELCITRQIITAIKTATRQKHAPLNSYISLYKPIYGEESDYTLLDVITGAQSMDPEAWLIKQEKSDDLDQKIAELLSELERNVLSLYMEGKSYVEISEDLNSPVKTIDNALQRVKRKMERVSTVGSFA
ncbi:RNA polymerase sporulation sigma factor SigH [Metabacillus sp. GX 13764]|uniref:RNA polymerase sporulation sigma factor SigH n=1 Tax=Metabacillus kandeliae TaxID=2900151 RepID=UPI001E4EF5A2|nr:RNA polymerase sporulation sigma factor SigH [Metabacillus kandeliae]MCD7035561.1 RNA polymerase sporulation sigma factor SigH [Metabacillus kandeliae]